MWLLNLQVTGKAGENLIDKKPMVYRCMYEYMCMYEYVCVFVVVYVQISCNFDGDINTIPFFGEAFRKFTDS